MSPLYLPYISPVSRRQKKQLAAVLGKNDKGKEVEA
jgi:hypothetical protein